MSESRILVTADEAARLLAIGRSTFWANVKAKRLPEPVKIGGATRWRLAELLSCVGASLTTMPSIPVSAAGIPPGYTQP
jgi:predicted DNA-binding transcriptional regulator AlpA